MGRNGGGRRQHGHQVRHQRPARQRLLLQPQRILRRQHALSPPPAPRSGASATSSAASRWAARSCKNKTFYFLYGESQLADAANATAITTLSQPGSPQGKSLLAHVRHRRQSGHRRTGHASGLRRVRTGAGHQQQLLLHRLATTYNSYNGIVKIDHPFNEQPLAQRPLLRRHRHPDRPYVDSNAPFSEFFQVAPSHMHNFSVAYTSVLSPRPW